jgi:hypothetical protein
MSIPSCPSSRSASACDASTCGLPTGRSATYTREFWTTIRFGRLKDHFHASADAWARRIKPERELHIRRPKSISLHHEPLHLVERLILVLVLGNDDLPVLVPLFRHGEAIQARGGERSQDRCPDNNRFSSAAKIVRLLSEMAGEWSLRGEADVAWKLSRDHCKGKQDGLLVI